MTETTKSITNWIIFILVCFVAFGIVQNAIATTNKEVDLINKEIANINEISGANLKKIKSLPGSGNKIQNKNMDEKTITKAIFKTSMGDIEVTLRKETTETTANFIKLAKEGFYDGTRFHRVISNFMIQAGDPKSKDLALKNQWGTGGPGYVFKDEFFPNDDMEQGVLAMANAGPGTNGSQFFIVTAPQGTDWLTGKHTIFGKVTKGLDVALAIEKVPTEGSDRPIKDVIIQQIVLQ